MTYYRIDRDEGDGWREFGGGGFPLLRAEGEARTVFQHLRAEGWRVRLVRVEETVVSTEGES